MKKKLLLLAVATCFTLVGSAQIQTNKNDVDTGFNPKVDIGGGAYRCQITFNFGTGKNAGLNGFKQKMIRNSSGFKGIQAQTINDIGAIVYNQKWGNGTGSVPNNMYHFYSVTNYLDSVFTSGKPWESTQSWYKPQVFITDIDSLDQAWTIYPGIYHNQWYGIQVKRTNYIVKSLNFNVATIDKGTTGAKSAYKLIVMIDKDYIGLASPTYKALLDTLTASNAATVATQIKAAEGSFFVADNVYTPSTTLFTKQNISVDLTGITLDQLNKATNIYALLYCNNKVASTNGYDPVIAVDDIQYDYADAGWTRPLNVTEGARISDSIDVTPNVAAYDTIYVTGYGRSKALTVVAKHAEVGIYSSDISNIHFLETAGIKAFNTSTGAYDKDVTYTYAKDENNNETLTIAKPESGAVGDTLAIVYAYNLPTANKTYYQDVEISNGVKFIDYRKLHCATSTGVTPAKIAASIYTGKNSIRVANADGNVVITNIGGATIANVSAAKAAKGVAVAKGSYIVKLNSGTIKKVLVK